MDPCAFPASNPSQYLSLQMVHLATLQVLSRRLYDIGQFFHHTKRWESAVDALAQICAAGTVGWEEEWDYAVVEAREAAVAAAAAEVVEAENEVAAAMAQVAAEAVAVAVLQQLRHARIVV